MRHRTKDVHPPEAIYRDRQLTIAGESPLDLRFVADQFQIVLRLSTKYIIQALCTPVKQRGPIHRARGRICALLP